ncbi:MAG: hypothetical protein GYB49_13590 [Alphaproteobacteria bacterium]|nr:hypothetical protein [Alphaproteobacteria bacterium]|tara:strand:- start:4744 stop:5064 length:321 start_codon:yes stop_codon:yes gene_type:complete
MRELFDQDRAMTLGAVKQATAILAVIFFIAAVFAVLSGLGWIFKGHIFTGLSRIVASFAVLGFMYVVVRFLGEILAASHRLNDRLSILGDDLRSQRSKAPASDTEA